MGTSFSIAEIKNDSLRFIAKGIDTSQVSENDNKLDTKEIEVFKNVLNSVKLDNCDDDLNKILGLYKSEKSTEKERVELSWKEIGSSFVKMGKGLVKGMFCDEKGFSLKRTLTTVGIGALFVGAAPLAAALGATSAVVGGIATAATAAGAGIGTAMCVNGFAKTLTGIKEYYNSSTKQDAEASMDKAMGGLTEAMLSIGALMGVVKGAAKGVKMSTNVVNKTIKKTSMKNTETPKTYYPTTSNSNNYNVVKDSNGRILNEVVKNEKGQIVREDFRGGNDFGYVSKNYSYDKHGRLMECKKIDINGRVTVSKRHYDKNGDLVKITEEYQAGAVDGMYKSKNSYPQGMVKDVFYENHMTKNVYKDLNGNHLKTEWVDGGKVVKQEFTTPDARGRIKIETTKDGRTIEHYSDGKQNVIQHGLGVKIKY